MFGSSVQRFCRIKLVSHEMMLAQTGLLREDKRNVIVILLEELSATTEVSSSNAPAARRFPRSLTISRKAARCG